jgi:hypothetical protein
MIPQNFNRVLKPAQNPHLLRHSLGKLFDCRFYVIGERRLYPSDKAADLRGAGVGNALAAKGWPGRFRALWGLCGYPEHL